MTKTKPSRTRWRIALAFLVVFAAVVWLAAFPAYKRHRAIQEIERLGGRVFLTTDGPQWLIQWGIGLNRTYRVQFDDTEITNDELKQLNGLTNLEWLFLLDTEISDDGLKHLSGLTSLNYLHLRATHVTDDGLKHLSSLTNLRQLVLLDMEISDDGLKHLSGLTSLNALHLRGTHVTDDGVKMLQGSLPNCQIHWSSPSE